jgi:hypothetical protein
MVFVNVRRTSTFILLAGGLRDFSAAEDYSYLAMLIPGSFKHMFSKTAIEGY